MSKALLAWGLAFVFPCAAIAQIAILHIRVTEGDGAVHRAGSRVAHPLTVEITDETGRPQPGTAVSFRLPETGPSGILSNGLRTDVILTDAQGRASLRGLQVNHVSGPFRIRITAVKEQARAGIVSQQYIADLKGATSNTTAAAKRGSNVPAPVVQRHSRKWLVIALVAGGVVAGGIGAGAVAGKSSNSSAPAANTAAPVSVGVPTISLGRP